MPCRHRKMWSPPQDLVREILLWLPVKSLVRFQCVSKPWRALIRDSSFIEVQLQRSIQTLSERILVLYILEGKYCIVNVKREVQFDKRSKFIQLSSVLTWEWESRTRNHYNGLFCKVNCHCNGLFCEVNCKKEIVIWSPSIRKYKKIPFVKLDTFNYDLKSVHAEIGYDPVTNDYKIVIVVELSVFPEEYLPESEVLVYSLKENSWRRVEDKWPFKYYRLGEGTCLNGNMNWLVEIEGGRNKPTVLVTFDLTNEKFQVHPIPTEFLSIYSLRVIGGKLCARGCFESSVDCKWPRRWWMMEEYGVASSWRLLDFDRLYLGQPLMISEDGQEILMECYIECDREYFWYDIKKKTKRNVKILDIPIGCWATISQGNLFLIDGEKDGYTKRFFF